MGHITHAVSGSLYHGANMTGQCRRGGAGGLFCQAITGAGDPHGTDMGAKTKKKLQVAFLKSARRRKSEQWSFAPPSDESKCKTCSPKKGQNQGP